MEFLRCNLHITRPGTAYDLTSEAFASMVHFVFIELENHFSIGSSNEDSVICRDMLPHHIHCTIANHTLTIAASGAVQMIYNDQKIELLPGQHTSFQIFPGEARSFRWKFIIQKNIIRAEILPESEPIPTKMQKYLEIQYGPLHRVQEGKSSLIFKPNGQNVIKVLRPSYGKIRGVILRFINAARKYCALPPNMFLSIDEIVYRKEFPLAYVVMQYFPGESLENYTACKGILEPSEAIYLVRSLAQNLLVLQSRQYCCRNLTPENVLLDSSQRLRLTGFFLLKSQEHNVTIPGAQMVIPKFTAPEQIDNPTQADILADVFSLGAIFYNMLIGEPPFNFNHARQYVDFLKSGRSISPEDIQKKSAHFSPELCQLIAKMLSFDKKDRPSPEQLLAKLSDQHLASSPHESEEASGWQNRYAEVTNPEDMMEESSTMPQEDDSSADLIIEDVQDVAPTVASSTPPQVKNEAQAPKMAAEPSHVLDEEREEAEFSEIIEESFHLSEERPKETAQESASFSALLELDEALRSDAQPGDHGYTLKVIASPQGNRPLEYHFRGDRQIVIGREADFSIRNDALISRAHARLELVQGEWWLTDLRSRNGVQIRGKRISREKIVPGTEFTIGETTLRFQKNTTVSEILEDQDISEEAMDAMREIRITRMYPICSPNDTQDATSGKSKIRSPEPIALPKPQELAEEADDADDADKVLNEVYQEFEETMIHNSQQGKKIKKIDDTSFDKMKNVLLLIFFIFMALTMIALSFIFFFWQF